MKQRQAAVCDIEYNVGTLSVFSVGNRRRAMITLNLGNSGVPMPFQIDRGYECCMLPRHEYVRVAEYISLAMLLQLETVNVTYNGTHEKSLGQCKLSVVRRGVKHFVCLKIFSLIVMLVSMYLCNNLVITYFTVSVFMDIMDIKEKYRSVAYTMRSASSQTCSPPCPLAQNLLSLHQGK